MPNYKKEDLPKLVGREFTTGNEKTIATLDYCGEYYVVFTLKDEGGDIECSQLDESFFRAYPELLPETPEGFTRHFGGECPVDGDVVVEVIGITGDKAEHYCSAGRLAWRLVTAYRVIEQEKPKELDISEYWQIVFAGMLIGDGVYKSKPEAEVIGARGGAIGYKQVGNNIVELV